MCAGVHDRVMMKGNAVRTRSSPRYCNGDNLFITTGKLAVPDGLKESFFLFKRCGHFAGKETERMNQSQETCLF